MTRKKKDSKREPPISYRPPKGLRAEFDERVARSGLSTSAFITQAVFAVEMPRQSRRPAAAERDIARILARLAQITDALKNHETATGRNAQTQALIAATSSEISEIRAALFKALGRQP